MNSSLLKIGSALIVALGLFSCGDDELKDPTSLSELRVLTIIADTPEIADASTTTAVQITPYIADPTGEGRTLTVVINGCTEPDISSGADPTCTGQSDSQELQNYTYDPASTTTDYASPHYVGALPTFTVNVPANFLTDATTQEKFNGLGYMLEMTVSSGSDSVRAIKRILVSGRSTLHTNPTISEVLSGTETLSSYPTATGDFKATAGSGSAESYTVVSGTGTNTLEENLTFRWFATTGTLSKSLTEDTGTVEYVPNSSASNPVIAVLLTDSRGGSAIQISRF